MTAIVPGGLEGNSDAGDRGPANLPRWASALGLAFPSQSLATRHRVRRPRKFQIVIKNSHLNPFAQQNYLLRPTHIAAGRHVPPG